MVNQAPTISLKLRVFQLLYQEMRQAYDAQKKPMDNMKEKVKQLLEVLEEPMEAIKTAGKKASQEPTTNPKKKQKTAP